jgi:hypothetical protein
MAWETSLTNRREGGRNRTRDRKGSSEPEDPAHKREPLTERGFRALAEPRPVLRGLRQDRRPSGILKQACRDSLSATSCKRRWAICGFLACRAETRSQGIATGTGPPAVGNGGASTLQSRDPFSWDCDPDKLRRSSSTQPACRAETRSQGIATGYRRANQGGYARLAEPRPVLRGLRPMALSKRQSDHRDPCRAETRSQGIATPGRIARIRMITLEIALQSRDPFSGDCDVRATPHGQHPECPDLQSRDPFSGDCDPSDEGMEEPESRGMLPSLAEPRPVLRGLRP